MHSEEIHTLVQSIPDGREVSAVIVDAAGKEHKYECTFKTSEAPCFFLLFPSGALPADLDTRRKCIVTGLNDNGQLLTLGASIINFANNRLLELEATDTFRPEDLREFFRVDLRVPAIVSFSVSDANAESSFVEHKGETIDISQSGVLIMLTEECKRKESLTIELMLPNPRKNVELTGKMVRKHRVKRDRWLTAFHFENPEECDRDAIAKNCFTAQRRQLRENVQTAR